MSNATDTTPSLDEKLVHLRYGKSVTLHKEELIKLLGKSQVQALLQAKSVQEIEDKREFEHDFSLAFTGYCFGALTATMTVAGVVLLATS